MNEYKGWGPWKLVWLSGCSRHQKPEAACPQCRNGAWSSLWGMKISQWVFAVAPTLWKRWANRGRRV